MSEATFRRGQFVCITYGTKTTEGLVIMASANGRSLMLAFDGALVPSHGEGMYPGAMPVLMDDEGVYRDLLNNEPVLLRPRGLGEQQ